MEAEVVQMCVNLFNGGENICGKVRCVHLSTLNSIQSPIGPWIYPSTHPIQLITTTHVHYHPRALPPTHYHPPTYYHPPANEDPPINVYPPTPRPLKFPGFAWRF